MTKKSKIFVRIEEICSYYGIKSTREFAIKHLGYHDAEKIYRLGRKDVYPGVEVIIDIANHFPEIDLTWFLTGKGKMLKNENLEMNTVNEPTAEYKTVTLNYKDAFDFARAEAEHHRDMNKSLMDLLEDFRNNRK